MTFNIRVNCFKFKRILKEPIFTVGWTFKIGLDCRFLLTVPKSLYAFRLIRSSRGFRPDTISKSICRSILEQWRFIIEGDPQIRLNRRRRNSSAI